MNDKIFENDPNLARGLISVHHRRETGGWTHSQSLETWPTIAAATEAAIAWVKAHPEIAVRGITGHADGKLLRAAGIRRVDWRGVSGKSKRSRENSFSEAKARAAAEGRPWV